MSSSSRRCAFTTLIGWMLTFSVANAQQDIVESSFDEAPPVLEDNLPPGVAPQTALSAEEVAQEPAAPVIVPTINQQMMPFNSKRIELVEAFQKPLSAVIINGYSVQLKNPERVLAFYQTEQYPTIWTHENRITGIVKQLQEAILTSDQDGLNPGAYHQSIIQALKSGMDYQDIIALEVVMTDAWLALADDLANGLVGPSVTSPTWDVPVLGNQELSTLLARGVVSNDVLSPLQEQNNNPAYQALKTQYNLLRDVGGGSREPTLPAGTLRVGMRGPAVAILRQRLQLPAGQVFDQDVQAAVKAFQRGEGLSADGVVGPGTRSRLNGNSGFNTDDLLINMERLRWMPEDWGNPYLVANIPAYRVEMIRDQAVVYETRAVVGRTDRQTPRFTDRLRHIVMSPTWTVPPTIMKKDKLPKLKSNPGAFDGSFEVVLPGGKVVSPSSVNWSSANAKNYTLRQKPGPRNALGRVKFLFPNKHAIYLHDTPSRSLFNRSYRAKSSGCIRLQKPLELADILLEGTKWTPERIEQLSRGKKQRWINPPQETPIYLVYWTTWADVNGQIHHADDVYTLDAALINAYNKALIQ